MGELRSQTWNGEADQRLAKDMNCSQPWAEGAQKTMLHHPSSYAHLVEAGTRVKLSRWSEPRRRYTAAEDDGLIPLLLTAHRTPPWFPLAPLNWKPADMGAWKTQSVGTCHSVLLRAEEEWGMDQEANIQMTNIMLCVLPYICSSQSTLPGGGGGGFLHWWVFKFLCS